MSFQRLIFATPSTPNRNPSYSPDGSKIVFSRQFVKERDGISHLFLMDADGAHVVQLTHGNYKDFGPKFSPDGKKIYFLRKDIREAYSSSTAAIYFITIDGSLIQNVTKAEYGVLCTISISQDGKYLFVSGDRICDKNAGCLTPIKIINANNGNLEALVKPNIKEYHPVNTIPILSAIHNPTVLPNRNIIIFSASFQLQNRSGNPINDSPISIYAFDQNTEKVRKIIDTYYHWFEGLNISLDGKKIAFCTGPPYYCDKIWVANIDGSDLKNIDIKLK